MSEIKAVPSIQKNNKILPDAIIIHVNGIIRFINPAGLRLFGFSSADDVVGKEIYEFVRPDDHECVKERIRQIESEEIFQSPLQEMKLIHNNGSILNTEVTAVCAQYKAMPAVMSIIIDRTSEIVKEDEIQRKQSVENGTVRRKTEEEAMAAMQKSRGLEKLFELIADGVAMYDAKGKILWVNSSQIELVGGDMAGLTWNEWNEQYKQMSFHYPDGWQLTQEEYPAIRALRGDVFSNEILSFNDLNNVSKIVSVSGCPLIENGEIIGALVVMLDVTKQEENTNKSKGSLQKKVDILESIDDGLLSLDREWRISYANRRIVKVLGLTENDIGSKSIWEKFPKLSDSEVGEKLRKSMEGKTSCRFEFKTKLTDRRYLATVYPTAGGISVYVIDITNTK